LIYDDDRHKIFECCSRERCQSLFFRQSRNGWTPLQVSVKPLGTHFIMMKFLNCVVSFLLIGNRLQTRQHKMRSVVQMSLSNDDLTDFIFDENLSENVRKVFLKVVLFLLIFIWHCFSTRVHNNMN
jgi:hypothetical protein